jgi:hypothetical protein
MQDLTAISHNGGAVGQHFGHAGAYIVGVVTHADDGIAPHAFGMLHHQFIGIFASFFAHIAIYRNIAAKNRLNTGGKIANHAARANNDAANEPEAPDDSAARQFVRIGHHLVIHHHDTLMN